MLTMRKTIGMAVSLLLTAVPQAATSGQDQPPPEQRRRQRRESLQQRVRELLEAQEQLLQEVRELGKERGVPLPRERFDRPGRFRPHEIEGAPEGEGALQTFLEALEHRRLADDFGRARLEIAALREGIRALRREQRELRANAQELERAGLFPERDRTQAEVERVRREIMEHEAQIARVLQRQQGEAEQQHLRAMMRRLEYVANWREIAFDTRRAVMMATQAVVELEMDRGVPEDATVALEALLEQVQELGSRTAIRFALKDIYMETDQPGRAREQMIQVILENARGIQKGE